ncbi:hypothetical protein CONPUDRAFT_152316 [Coniophora puteana RWD-64-598 SS2]|uniref:Alpha beta-hydrolase n=1 Tax=Coniophora puteana (strain RWD-64-598) TaxID=741705 RepID=A0A5M3MW53_CONPW|nr:uncharacterized protein CONPUDRAFT_152316 [Coniophora puteana RWD-64-598 SS2]EIW83290.1 hypothetical protein CONPUDRAFT_152316 [Coniophora puteana RWD-64-598 SS2]
MAHGMLRRTTSHSVDPSKKGAMMSFVLSRRAGITTHPRQRSKQMRTRFIVAAHSSGCVIASEAISAFYGRKARSGEHKEGGVLHIVYMCALVVEEGMSVADQWGLVPEGLTDGLDITRNFDMFETRRSNVFDDVPNDELERCRYVQKLHYPVTYVFCTEDNVWPHDYYQKASVRNILVEYGAVVAEKTLGSGRSPFITHLDELVNIVDEIVKVAY